jgi:hypothetical protein
MYSSRVSNRGWRLLHSQSCSQVTQQGLSCQRPWSLQLLQAAATQATTFKLPLGALSTLKPQSRLGSSSHSSCSGSQSYSSGSQSYSSNSTCPRKPGCLPSVTWATASALLTGPLLPAIKACRTARCLQPRPLHLLHPLLLVERLQHCQHTHSSSQQAATRVTPLQAPFLGALQPQRSCCTSTLLPLRL